MWRSRLSERHEPRRHPALRLLGLGVLVELVWAAGLLVVLGLLSVAIWAALEFVATR